MPMQPESPGPGYRLLALLLYPFWIVHALRHGFKNKLQAYLSMRLCASREVGSNCIWVHASSVGEVRAVTPLVQALIQQGETILFTSFTATGHQAIHRNFDDSVISGVIPIDVIWHCRRFFQRHQIRLGLVMETELWPELLYQARKQQIELLLINARLSRKSLHTGGFLRGLLSRTLGYFERILARNETDRDNFLSLDANPQAIEITGNLKFQQAQGPPPDRLIERDYLLLASSHSGEEQQFLASRPSGLEPLIVVAPRHPQRSAAIQNQIAGLDLDVAVRSKGQAITGETEVYLADTLGELDSFMAFARIVVMGGSFDATGGHNLIEPAALGCAIITGPADSNIVEDINMLGRDQAVIQVADMPACWAAIARLLENPALAQTLGQQARARLAQQADIVEQYLAAIRRQLGSVQD